MDENNYVWIALISCLVVCPLGIAVLAQTQFKRLGMLWFGIAFAMNLGILYFFDKPNAEERRLGLLALAHRQNMKLLAEAILNPTIVSVICFIILLTLPRRALRTSSQ